MDLCPSELVGKSCYQFIHGEDVEEIRQSHLDCKHPSYGPLLWFAPALPLFGVKGPCHVGGDRHIKGRFRTQQAGLSAGFPSLQNSSAGGRKCCGNEALGTQETSLRVPDVPQIPYHASLKKKSRCLSFPHLYNEVTHPSLVCFDCQLFGVGTVSL